jgi:hypothetical protein
VPNLVPEISIVALSRSPSLQSVGNGEVINHQLAPSVGIAMTGFRYPGGIRQKIITKIINKNRRSEKTKIQSCKVSRRNAEERIQISCKVSLSALTRSSPAVTPDDSKAYM